MPFEERSPLNFLETHLTFGISVQSLQHVGLCTQPGTAVSSETSKSFTKISSFESMFPKVA